LPGGEDFQKKAADAVKPAEMHGLHHGVCVGWDDTSERTQVSAQILPTPIREE
jgi:uncharacterized protein YgfB (UPF0149 family)